MSSAARHWLSHLLRAWRARPLAGRGPRRAQRGLELEPLEDRQLLATFTVLNTNDAGPGSLRQAILDANATPGLDAINFNIGAGVQTIHVALTSWVGRTTRGQ